MLLRGAWNRKWLTSLYLFTLLLRENGVWNYCTKLLSHRLKIVINSAWLRKEREKCFVLRRFELRNLCSAGRRWMGYDYVVKCTLVQTLRLCTGRTVHRGSRGIALPFHDHGTRSGWGVSVTPRPLFTPRKDSVPIVQEAGWATGPVWIGAENLAPHRDLIPGPSSP